MLRIINSENSLLLTVVLAITYKVLPFLFYYFIMGYVLPSNINFTFSVSKTKSSLMSTAFPSTTPLFVCALIFGLITPAKKKY